MSTIGIIAEFNPLHSGHQYLIEQAKKCGDVVCVISGNFVQRGETALLEKEKRTEMALNCGADLVLELPVCWSMSTAQNFALGGVSILDSIGCDTLMFGSETDDLFELVKSADVLDNPDFKVSLLKKLEDGITFAVARELAAQECGVQPEILSGANSNLAVEYILAAKRISSKMEFMPVKRLGAGHDSTSVKAGFVSASLLRKEILGGNYYFAKQYMPPTAFEMIKKPDLSDFSRLERAILAVLRTKTIDELANLPDLSEGIENKLFSSIQLANSLDGLYNEMKVKRYSHARIRRLALSAFIGIDNSQFLKSPPYIRVLGFNRTGERIIKENCTSSKIPVVMRVSEIETLFEPAQKVFETEKRATDLFSLSLKVPHECGLEYKRKLIKKEC